MIIGGKRFGRAWKPLFVGASCAALGLALVACSPGGSGSILDGINTTGAAPPSGSVIKMQVSGDQDTALVAANVTTGDGNEIGEKTKWQKLPYTQEFTVPQGQSLSKIFVYAQYTDNSKASISCSVEIDGKEVAAMSANNPHPLECLFFPIDSAH